MCSSSSDRRSDDWIALYGALVAVVISIASILAR